MSHTTCANWATPSITSLKWVLLAAIASLSACSETVQTQASSPTSGTTRADFGVESYLPLIDKTVLSFETETEGVSERGLLVMQIRRPRETLVELTVGSKVHRLDLVRDGVRVVEGGWLLKTPLEVGSQFPGQYGTVTVKRVAIPVEVPAGRFEGCIETEEVTGTTKTLTHYCPTIGIVELEVESFSAESKGREIARLKSHGPLVDLGGDQVKVTQ